MAYDALRTIMPIAGWPEEPFSKSFSKLHRTRQGKRRSRRRTDAKTCTRYFHRGAASAQGRGTRGSGGLQGGLPQRS